MLRPLALCLVTLGITACPTHSPAWYELTDEAPDTMVPPGDTAADTTAGSSDTAAGSSDTSTGATVSDSGGAGEEGSSGPGTVSTTTTTGATTGEPEPVCGNGMLESFGPTPEECDDGNMIPDDGCDATCAADRRVFVSSLLYQAGDIKSLYLADAKCANMAVQVGFPEPLKFRAWLSDSTTDAALHIKFGRGRIVLVNGLVVADSWLALITGEIQTPIEVTEKGETYHGGVWTGTRPDGTGVPGASHCEDWTTTSFNKVGYYGYSDRATPEWTQSAEFDNPYPCLGDFALYCFEEL